MTKYLIASTGFCAAALVSPIASGPVEDQTERIARIERELKLLQLIAPEKLDEALEAVLKSEDPVITKAVTRYRAASIEYDNALKNLKETQALLVESHRRMLATEEQILEKLKKTAQ
jgi:hypothetical protein